MASTPTESKSVSAMLKQQVSRGKHGVKDNTSGPGAPNAIGQNLNPVLPPLYPPMSRSIQPNLGVFGTTVQTYNRLAQHFRSNLYVAPDVQPETAFHMTRFTDQYKSPHALEPHLLHKLPDSRFPSELTQKTLVKAKPVLPVRKRQRLEQAKDGESLDNANEEAEEKKSEKSNDEDNDELEEEFDEEMDAGTDYSRSYFDDGEGDEEDKEDDADGPTF